MKRTEKFAVVRAAAKRQRERGGASGFLGEESRRERERESHVRDRREVSLRRAAQLAPTDSHGHFCEDLVVFI